MGVVVFIVKQPPSLMKIHVDRRGDALKWWVTKWNAPRTLNTMTDFSGKIAKYYIFESKTTRWKNI